MLGPLSIMLFVGLACDRRSTRKKNIPREYIMLFFVTIVSKDKFMLQWNFTTPWITIPRPIGNNCSWSRGKTAKSFPLFTGKAPLGDLKNWQSVENWRLFQPRISPFAVQMFIRGPNYAENFTLIRLLIGSEFKSPLIVKCPIDNYKYHVMKNIDSNNSSHRS